VSELLPSELEFFNLIIVYVILIDRCYVLQQVFRVLYVCVSFCYLYWVPNIIRTYNEYYVIYYNLVLPSLRQKCEKCIVLKYILEYNLFI